ncbi:MAG: DUF4249 domain-containing protein, partial [Bacteroidota bacterium]
RCFLSPDQSEIQLSLRQSQLIGTDADLSHNNLILTDATILVENISQARSLALSFDATSRVYRSAKQDSFLRSGDQYQLKIEHPDFPAVTGQCQIPGAPQQFSVQLDSTIDDPNAPEFFVRTSWEDPVGERNFYRLIGQVIPDTVAFHKQPWYFLWRGLDPEPDFITDEGIEQVRITGPLGDLQTIAAQAIDSRPARQARYPRDSVRVALLQVNEAYFRYMLDLRQARQTGRAFSEPYQVYTNLEGAIGIFAAYHADERRLRIR